MSSEGGQYQPFQLRCAEVVELRVKTRKGLLLITFASLLGGCTQLNQYPVASFSCQPTSGSAPLTVSFDASRSRDPDGRIVSYSWSFGDGHTSSGITAANTYSQAGSYSPRLTVRDDEGAADTSVRTITVLGPSEHGMGDSAANEDVRVTLLGVRSSTQISEWYDLGPGQIYVIVNVRVEAIRDDQYVSKFDFKLIQSDGRVQDDYSLATYSLARPFEDADLDTGQWTDGEIAFEVFPVSSYVLEYEEWLGWSTPIRFRFSV